MLQSQKDTKSKPMCNLGFRVSTWGSCSACKGGYRGYAIIRFRIRGLCGLGFRFGSMNGYKNPETLMGTQMANGMEAGDVEGLYGNCFAESRSILLHDTGIP